MAKSIHIYCPRDERGGDGCTAYLELGRGETIKAFCDDTHDAAIAKARTWARDLRDALNAADLDTGDTTPSERCAIERNKDMDRFYAQRPAESPHGLARGEKREDGKP